jgi:prepilin-type N-terminal cleavage/methylation domain-containing protein
MKGLRRKGFSLVEVVIGIAIVGIALLGLAQLFTYSVLVNSRSERMTKATFLAQQRIEFLRNISSIDLIALPNPTDEQIDIDNDETADYRRITQIQPSGHHWDVRILVFSMEQASVVVDTLLEKASEYNVRADISTVISR